MLNLYDLVYENKVVGYRLSNGLESIDMDVDYFPILFSRVESSDIQYKHQLDCILEGNILRVKSDIGEKGMTYSQGISEYLVGTTELNAREVVSSKDLLDFIDNNTNSINKEMTLLSLRYVQCKAQLLDIWIPLGQVTSISVNSRLTNAWGRCNYFRGRAECKLEFSAILLNCASIRGIDMVITHELLHTCKGCNKHTGLWLKYARYVNDSLGYDISRISSSSVIVPTIDRALENGYHCCECRVCGNADYRDSLDKIENIVKHYHCHCGGRYIAIF